MRTPALDRNILILFLFAVFCVFLLGFLATPIGHSYKYNLPWLVGFEDALRSGAIYPRHLPALWSGAGGLDLYFYGPLPFYLAAGPARLICLTCSPQTVFGITGGLLLAGSTIAFYPLARRFLPATSAVAAAVAYALMPYHVAIDWCLRQAAGEFAAYIFVPLVAAGMIAVLREGRISLSLPLGFAGLILSHLPTALLMGHVFGLIFLVWAIGNPRKAPAAALRLAAMATVGLALAGLYWLPAVILLDSVSSWVLFEPHLKPTNWLLFDGAAAPDPATAHVVTACLAVGMVVAGLGLIMAPPADRRSLLLWIGLPVLLSALMTTDLARPVWEHWIIDAVQFPWRLMVFVDMSAALAVGVLAGCLSRGPRARAGALLGLTLLALGFVVLTALMAEPIGDGFATRDDPVRVVGATEYLPAPFFDPIARAVVEDGRPAWRSLDDVERTLAEARERASGYSDLAIRPSAWTVVPAAAGPVTLPIPYWRFMEARTDGGEPVALAPSDDLGLVTFAAPQGASRIEIRLPRHWTEQVGLGLSLLGLAGLGVVAGQRWRAARRQPSVR